MLLFFWIFSGVISFGFYMGYFCKRFPYTKDGSLCLKEFGEVSDPKVTYKRHLSLSPFIAGPFGIFATLLVCNGGFHKPIFTINQVKKCHQKLGIYKEENK